MRTSSNALTATFILALHLSLGRPCRADDWDNVTKWLPESSNAVMVIDVDGLFNSPMAITNDWRKSQSEEFARGLTILPPFAQKFVLATELDLKHLEPRWEFAAMSLAVPVGLEQVYQKTGGSIVSAGGLRAVRTPRGSFIVPLDPQEVALIRIASSDWVDQALRQAVPRSHSQLSSFLTVASERVAQGECQIAVALELQEAISEDQLRIALERNEETVPPNVNRVELAEAMSSLEGIVFTVRVAGSMRGRLEVVFHEQPNLEESDRKSLILSTLEMAGANLPEFQSWGPSTGIHSLAIEGELSPDGLRRVLSLLHYDTSDMDVLRTNPSPIPKHPLDRATQRYIERVTQLVNGLAKGAQTNNLRGQVLWADRAAKEMVRAIRDDVDSEVAELGYRVAYQLENIVSSFNYAADVAQARIAATNRPNIEWRTELFPYSSFKTPYGRFYRYAPFSYGQVNLFENAARANTISTEQFDLANQRARQMFSEIEELVRKMNDLAKN